MIECIPGRPAAAGRTMQATRAAEDRSMATRKRTTMYSTGGKKLYAVRNADGTFKDIQTYARAHAADIRKVAKDE